MQYIFLMKISSIFYQPTITQRILKIYVTLTHMHPLINLITSCEKRFFDMIVPLEFAVATEVYDSQIWNNRVCQH